MSLERDRVYDTEELDKLSNMTQTLMDAADTVIEEIYSELSSLSSTLASLPADVRDSGLKQQVDDLKASIRTDEFKEYKTKILSCIKRINKNVPLQDKRLGTKIEHVTEVMQTMKERLKNLKDFVPAGADSGSYVEFEKAFEECTKNWDTLNSQFNELMEKIKDSLKGGKNTQVCYGGDPVNLSTGNFIYEKTDMEISGKPRFHMTRYYNELDKRCGIFGRGWRHTFEARLVIKDNTYIVILPDGKEESFEKKADGSFYGKMTVSRFRMQNDRYVYSTKIGEAYFFHANGQCVLWKDAEHREIRFSYQEEMLKRVERTEDKSYFLFTYNERKQLSLVTDQTGRCVSYQYDETGRLCESVDPQGEANKYSYDEESRMFAITDEEKHRTVKNQYDEEGRTTHQEFLDGGVITYEYEDEKKAVTVKERNGSSVIYYHNDSFQNIRTVYEDGEERFLYNHKGQRILHRDCNGNTTRFAYDNRGNLTQVIDAMGVKSNATYDQKNHLLKISVNQKEQLKNEYDSHGNLIESKDALGRKTSFQYWKDGLPEQIRKPDGGSVSLTYDERGNIVNIINPLKEQFAYEYDELNRVIAATDGKGAKSFYSYDKMNRITKYRNPLGQTMEYTYNACGSRQVSGDMMASVFGQNIIS